MSKEEKLQEGYAYINIYKQDGFDRQHVYLNDQDVAFLVDKPSASKVSFFALRIIKWLQQLDNQEHFHLVKARYEKKIEYLHSLQQPNYITEIIIGSDFVTFNKANSAMTMTFEKLPIKECLQPFKI